MTKSTRKKYKAKDYAKIDQKKKIITLYNEAELYYKDVELKDEKATKIENLGEYFKISPITKN